MQLDISSFLRFSELNLGWQIITYFSCKHKSHFFLVLEQGLQRLANPKTL